MTKPKPLMVPNAVRTSAEHRRDTSVQYLGSKKNAAGAGSIPAAGGNPDPIWQAQQRAIRGAVNDIQTEITRLESLTGDDLVRAFCPDWVASQERPYPCKPAVDHWRIDNDRVAGIRQAEREANTAARNESIRTGKRFQGIATEYTTGPDR